MIECSGTECASVAGDAGVVGWPCTTTVQATVGNLDDPNLPPLEDW